MKVMRGRESPPRLPAIGVDAGVTVSRRRRNEQRSTRVDTPELAHLAPKIETPDFKSMDDCRFNAAMVDARNEFHQHVFASGLVLANKVLPGIDDAARRFQQHKDDKEYRLDGQDCLTGYIHSLGYKPATIRKWRQRLKDRELIEKVKLLTGSSGTKTQRDTSVIQRDKHDATDIARLERVALAAQEAADAHLDDDTFDGIRMAIQKAPQSLHEVASRRDIVTLALEAFEIIFNDLGDQLIGTAKGKRLIDIAQKGLELARRKPI